MADRSTPLSDSGEADRLPLHDHEVYNAIAEESDFGAAPQNAIVAGRVKLRYPHQRDVDVPDDLGVHEVARPSWRR